MNKNIHPNGIIRRYTAAAAVLMLSTSQAFAWPDKPVKIVVGFSAGGIADTAARILAENLQKKYGQAVTVENRAGAGGRLATDMVAKSEDGHTLGIMTGGDTVVAASDPKLPYNLSRDIQYITTLSVYPFVVVAPADSKLSTMQQLVDAARAAPGTVRFASAGVGSTQHMAGELMAAMASVDLTHVPYRGSSAALLDVIGGRVEFTIAAANTVRGELQAGKLKTLAVTSAERSPSSPSLPAVSETIKSYEVNTWMGLATSSRVPATVVDQLNRDVRAIMATPAVKERFVALGVEPLTGTGAEMKSRVETEVPKWRNLLQSRRIDLTQ